MSDLRFEFTDDDAPLANDDEMMESAGIMAKSLVGMPNWAWKSADEQILLLQETIYSAIKAATIMALREEVDDNGPTHLFPEG